MSEKLTIRNFGPLKSVELDLKRLNVLIGENATGKSTVAKILAMCRYFSYIIKNDLSVQPFEAGLVSWGLNDFIQDDTYIYYDCIHYSFKVERILTKDHDYDQQDGSHFEYDFPIFSSELKSKSNEFRDLLSELEKIKPSDDTLYGLSFADWSIPTSFFLNDVSRVIDNPFYLPTERGLQSVFSLGKNSIPNIADSLFNQFANLDLITKNFKDETSIEPLGISYKNVDGRGFVKKKDDDTFYSLYNGASGYKSAIPVILAVKYYNDIRKKKKTFLIEEPELNLFPKAQQKLMEFLGDQIINYSNSILVTTHSPYILTSLNNMMYAYQIGQEHNEEVEKIIGRKYWLNHHEVTAYIMLPDGTFEDIMDKEENLIKAEKIDSVSGFLNIQFDALLNIELSEK
ncbi:MAG: AAA family ATPase [Ferruginibacter sp.]